jgi:hypothetical protein
MAMRAILALGILLAWVPGAYALDPALDVSQYAHTAADFYRVRSEMSTLSIRRDVKFESTIR